MSALRIASPYHETRLVDLGPSHARVAGFGGRMVVPVAVQRVKGQRVNIPTANELKREAARMERKRQFGATCRRIMRTGEPCARAGGHRSTCESRATMDNRNQTRRKWTP